MFLYACALRSGADLRGEAIFEARGEGRGHRACALRSGDLGGSESGTGSGTATGSHGILKGVSFEIFL